jgi:hypothetical protein
MLISLLIKWSRPTLLKTNFKWSKYSTSMRTNLHSLVINNNWIII